MGILTGIKNYFVDIFTRAFSNAIHDFTQNNTIPMVVPKLPVFGISRKDRPTHMIQLTDDAPFASRPVWMENLDTFTKFLTKKYFPLNQDKNTLNTTTVEDQCLIFFLYNIEQTDVIKRNAALSDLSVVDYLYVSNGQVVLHVTSPYKQDIFDQLDAMTDQPFCFRITYDFDSAYTLVNEFIERDRDDIIPIVDKIMDLPISKYDSEPEDDNSDYDFSE